MTMQLEHFEKLITLQNDVYTLLVKAKTGSLDNHAVSGFTIPVRAIFDEEENRQTLQTLLTTT